MFNSILVPVDLNDDSSWKRALPAAMQLVQPNNAELHLVCVVPDMGSNLLAGHFPDDFEKKAVTSTREKLTDFAAGAIPDDVKHSLHVGYGAIYREILRVADENRCDLIVMGSHHPALADYLLGPNAARVVRHADQSVMVVRDLES